MARSRNIKPSFFTNEYLAELSFEARLLFIGLWTLADRRGRLEDRPKGIKGKLFPFENLDTDSLLMELAQSPEAFIIRYEIGGKRYIQITNFEKHQNPHIKEAESIIPEPCLHDTNTIQEHNKHDTSHADSLNPITDSLKLIPDCGCAPAAASTPAEPQKHKYGEYGWVKLTDAEYQRLIDDHGEDTVKHYITYVDESAEKTGNKNKWKNWNLTVRNAIRDKWGNNSYSNAQKPSQSSSSASYDIKELEEMINKGGIF